ncbi:unnamed protein product [Didymodactylos carnosus]|uniref:Integrase catalytic domain-containing protein n=1 Tax=Didymodactylos carnosus TaxID=1234261 RepID=A0A815JRN4_9BILA|nr:unnamed protein product [Didymodactylos carnosus]CAF4274224.1 unnamed protein product [Didymodactylos carnosus]
MLRQPHPIVPLSLPSNLPDPDQQPTTTRTSLPISPAHPSVINLSLDAVTAAQERDPKIRNIIDRIRDGKNESNFVLHDNILYCLVSKNSRATRSHVPYIPPSMVPAVLETFHDHPLSSHFGVRRTLYKIKPRAWWPNMQRGIENHIASCHQCAHHRTCRKKIPGHLKSIEPPNDVFQVIHLDFWDPVRSSKQGNQYVLVLTDNLSKYVIAQALPNNTVKATAEVIINNFILVHGVPERIITDNGVHFNNALVKVITSAMNINHAFSASYHPQTNGQVERFNATFSTQLAKYCNEDHDDWDDNLQSVLYAYNTGIHATTGFTPYELAFGRKQNRPFDPIAPTITIPATGDFYNRLIRTRKILINHSPENIQRQQQRAKHRYDQHRKTTSYSIGDYVFVKVCTGRIKLDERWIDPCCIVDKSGE